MWTKVVGATDSIVAGGRRNGHREGRTASSINGLQ